MDWWVQEFFLMHLSIFFIDEENNFFHGWFINEKINFFYGWKILLFLWMKKLTFLSLKEKTFSSKKKWTFSSIKNELFYSWKKLTFSMKKWTFLLIIYFHRYNENWGPSQEFRFNIAAWCTRGFRSSINWVPSFMYVW